MARVTFKPGQPVQALSGTYGNAVFRTLPSGQTVVSFKPLADDDLPRPQRVIERCTADIQVAMGDMREAIDQRSAIKKRVGTLYGRLYSPPTTMNSCGSSSCKRTTTRGGNCRHGQERAIRLPWNTKKIRRGDDKTPMKPR